MGSTEHRPTDQEKHEIIQEALDEPHPLHEELKESCPAAQAFGFGKRGKAPPPPTPEQILAWDQEFAVRLAELNKEKEQQLRSELRLEREARLKEQKQKTRFFIFVPGYLISLLSVSVLMTTCLSLPSVSDWVFSVTDRIPDPPATFLCVGGISLFALLPCLAWYRNSLKDGQIFGNMDLRNAQWRILKPFLTREPRLEEPRLDPQDARRVLNGVLWRLRRGTPWQDLPKRYPPYEICIRWSQQWQDDGTLVAVLRALVADLRKRGKVDSAETFTEGSFVRAEKRALELVRRSAQNGATSWQLQTAMIFLSEAAWPALLPETIQAHD